MCGGPEHPKPSGGCETGTITPPENVNNSTWVDKLKNVENVYASLLELAANNDLIGLKQMLKDDVLKIEEASFWYGRKHGCNQMVLEQRTPAMIAALFGSLDVLKYILSIYSTYGLNINHTCGSDNSTALHCAVAGGSVDAIDTVKLLIQSGADVNSLDAFGRRPADLIMLAPKLHHARSVLRELSGTVSKSTFCLSEFVCQEDINSQVGNSNKLEYVSPLSSSPETLYISSPSASPNFIELPKAFCDNNEKKEYPIDPSLPDIKNSIYSTDEFRMFSFKVRPCSRAYSHDWTECPFVHPGENARRRDPRRFHYSCVPCPEFRKGACRRGDACEYAHGVFESWLHPAQYRTRLCKDGTSCARRVCFFAHKPEELRPLYVSTGSAVSSPKTSASIDMAAAMTSLVPGSPSSVLMMSSFSPSNSPQSNLFTPPMSPSSPSANKACHSTLGVWSQSSLPTLHLSSGSCQASRLRAALSARDLPLNDETVDLGNDGQIVNEVLPLSNQVRMNAALGALSGDGGRLSRSGKYRSPYANSVTPTTLEDLFASEMSLPGVAEVEPSVQQPGNQVQSNKAMQGHLQFQNQKQLSAASQTLPWVTTQVHQLAVDPQSPGRSFVQSSVLPSSYSLASLGRMSSLNEDLECENTNGALLSPVMSSPRNPRVAPFSNRERGSYGGNDLGAHVLPTISDWGLPMGKLDWGDGKLDWGVHSDELSKFRKSASFNYRNTNELDPPWNQYPVKGSQTDAMHDDNHNYAAEIPNNGNVNETDYVVQNEALSKFRKSASFGYRSTSELDSSWNKLLGKGALSDGIHDDNLDYSVETSNSGNVKDTNHAVLASWIDRMHLDQKLF
uniref:TSA: Wollemia nobilis Ref_Wollemi_Transcript_5835_3235 transcribed RNA sequence n=1 Tax=Wollemia nobilis TaxID=56998 RepID=A0A0C9S9W3_9CONI